MTEQYLSPIILNEEIVSELRHRKSKYLFKTVSASNKNLIAAKVKLEEQDGWRVVRKNAKSTRMAKPKLADEQLEDEVWSILAQMGFKEMSKDRNFKIVVEDDLPPHKVDIFAKDDESIIIVECMYRDTPGKRSMAKLIEKIRAVRENLLKTVRKHYFQQSRPKFKVKYVIATRNVEWSDSDITKCDEANISVITDGELDYYAKLVQHLRHAARYQLLGHLFGGQKIEGLTRQVVATRGKMGGEIFYTFLISPEDLLKIAYVGHKASRDFENLKTYQRMLQPKRLKKIAAYINSGGKFPTNIIVNIKTNKKLKFDVKEKFHEGSHGVLHLPSNYASAWIIDGQHRLYGYTYAQGVEGYKQDSTLLPVLAYENLSADKEMGLFIDINSKQVKVSTRLLVELYADLHWKSSNSEEAFQALLSRITSRLNNVPTSPLYSRMVVTGRKKTQFCCLTQTSIRDGLRDAKLLGTLNGNVIVPGPLSTDNAEEYEANLKKGLSVISDCLRMFAEAKTDHWKIGDGPGGYLCTNNGLRALFHVIKDIVEIAHQKDGTDLCHFKAGATFKAIEPYLKTLVEFFTNASGQEVQAFRSIGSSLMAVRRQAYEMEEQIQKKYIDFKPAGLQEYLNSRDEAETEEARKNVARIQKRIFDYVIGTLKQEYGTQGKAWWVKGVPLKIRSACSIQWETNDREGDEEEQLFLQNYVDICIQNWDILKDVISLDARDKEAKKANTKWISRLNAIRNKVFHPERGVLEVDEVTLVKNILDKVETFFPKDN